ncbi:thioredoxin-disulfide reductase [Acutalibacter sp. 1XD8-36]|uniref:thioredoxin-disulfide reductase n=1 Tax=Acutalibacter sp. 1XD8-36 TaxID=2320852 RepID=UPI0014133C2C|nr:thioredoxin-disulfide reductase [Acutalibacter sp. 1XD8-36]NBJ89077.1 thioredoxin-disulfide reductase [Acutalibacter sp. 1XD8-36]
MIIGGGPAGYTAALYGARAGLTVGLIEKLAPGGQMGTTDMVDNYPGFPDGINGFELAMNMKAGAERFGARTISAQVTGLELSGDVKILRTPKEDYNARTVILATGAQPRELGLPNERELRGRGVSYCATCDGMFYRGKTVAVVGGGNTAVADALYLSRICEKVYLIHRRDKLRAPQVQQQNLEKAGNVEFIWNSVVKEMRFEQRLTGLTAEHKETGGLRELECAGVFIAVGQVPETELFKDQVELDSSGYVVAGEDCRTSIPGVFAAGDLRAKPLRQIVTAASDGAVAATAAQEFLDM